MVVRTVNLSHSWEARGLRKPRLSACASVQADVPEWVAKGMKKERRRKKGRTAPLPTVESDQSSTPRQQSSRKISIEKAIQFERDGHVTVRQLVDASAISDLQQAVKQVIADGELDAVRHRCEAPMACHSVKLDVGTMDVPMK